MEETGCQLGMKGKRDDRVKKGGKQYKSRAGRHSFRMCGQGAVQFTQKALTRKGDLFILPEKQ